MDAGAAGGLPRTVRGAENPAMDTISTAVRRLLLLNRGQQAEPGAA
ncbi:hypothetical protein [Streptomyces sp. C8S0]|nr:hypothetical protein [Streptomyces sp. C8S0]